MNDQHVNLLLCVGNQVSEAGEIFVKGTKLPEPVVLPREHRWMVALALRRERIWEEVLAHQIDAVEKLEFRNVFQLHGGSIVPTAGKGFGQHLVDSKLTCNTADLNGHQGTLPISAEAIHARNVLVFIGWHHTGAAHHLCVK